MVFMFFSAGEENQVRYRIDGTPANSNLTMRMRIQQILLPPMHAKLIISVRGCDIQLSELSGEMRRVFGQNSSLLKV
jgi:hypothetical protein